MAHPHSHSPAQAPDSSNARRLRWAFIVTAGFMLIEAVGGAISGSLALLADWSIWNYSRFDGGEKLYRPWAGK